MSPQLFPILGETVNSLIRAQGIGDIYRIYSLAKRDGIDVKLTWVPSGEMIIEPSEIFDPAYMSALFDLGYRRALDGNVWVDVADVVN